MIKITFVDKPLARRKVWRSIILAGLAGVACLAASAPKESKASGLLDEGLKLAREGDYTGAISILERALESSKASREVLVQVSSALALAESRQFLGQICSATELLEETVPIADSCGAEDLRVRAHSALGNAYFLSRRSDLAERWLESSWVLAREAENEYAEAGILQSLACLAAVGEATLFRASDEKVPGAIPAEGLGVRSREPLEKCLLLFEKSERISSRLNDSTLLATILINKARALLRHGKNEEAKDPAVQCLEHVRNVPGDRHRAFLLVSCGHLLAALGQNAPDERDHWSAMAVDVYRQAIQLSYRTQDERTRSYAFGFMGELYLSERRYDEASLLTQNALYLAQRSNDDVGRLQWHWQQGRILSSQGEMERATEVYRQVARSLSALRSDVFVGAALLGERKPFRDSFGQVYFEFADLLLRGAPTDSATELTDRLAEARAAVEMLKLIEVEDYYLEEDCVDLIRSKARTVEALPAANTAILYCIVFQDRIELLLTLPTGMRRYCSAVGADRLSETAERFRFLLEQRASTSDVSYARELWNWLVAPLLGDLEASKIETLVFVPDGVLRTIPLAALHDGEHYLVERFAVAVSPGLSLMEPRPMPRQNLQVLLCGVSHAVEGYAPLESVEVELKEIESVLGGQTLLNGAFKTVSFESALRHKPLTIVHLATHAEFGADVSKTFIRTYDGRLTLDHLEQLLLPRMLNDQPLELLALSACQTAAGNEQAALGLAAVAVKAGARSALATLWKIDDEAAQRIMCSFYRSLMHDATASRAECLRRAQLELMTDRRLSRPGFWSPVLLIGSWL
jgi:CHAT domain-containing protein